MGKVDVSDREPDPRAILAALGVADADRIAPVAGGWDTRLWRVESGDRTHALRLFRPEQLETCRREVAALRAAAAAGLPVPALEGETIRHGRPALLLGWCLGRPLVDELRSHPLRTWRLGLAFGR